MKNTKRTGGPQVAEFYNPGPKFTLGLPGQRRKNMATRKRKKSGKRRNSATVRSATAVAHKKVSTSKRNPARRKSSGKRRNPFGLGGRIKPMEWASAGAGAILSEVASNLIPIGAAGSWTRIGVQLGASIILIPMVWPKSFHPEAATLGGAAAAASKALNKAFNIQGLLTNATQGLLPAPAPAPASAAAATAAGMGRFRGLVDFRGQPAGAFI